MKTAATKDGTDDGVIPLSERKSDATWNGAEGGAGASTKGKIRLLIFTSLYPNAEQPHHGVFVEERLRHLINSKRITATVVAPVPWFPFRHRRFGAYAAFARVPEREERYGIHILHPRYPVIPKVGMSIAPLLMYRALLPTLRRLVVRGDDFDLIDAHYFYPDGVVATKLGMAVKKPVVITARGTDVNVIAHYRLPGRQIKWAAAHAAAMVTVSQALKSVLAALGANPEKITVLRNGVDLDCFRPRDRAAIRVKWGLVGPVWLTVSHLNEHKGVHIVVEALAQVPDATLLIVGDGPDGPKLRDLVERLGLGARVQFLGVIRRDALCEYYNAADVMLLASAGEGMPNVVLESLACGTPVVAAPFDGITELVRAPEAGEIAVKRSAEAIASAWLRLRSRSPLHAATRSFAEQLGWQPVVEAQCELYERVLAAHASISRPEVEA